VPSCSDLAIASTESTRRGRDSATSAWPRKRSSRRTRIRTAACILSSAPAHLLCADNRKHAGRARWAPLLMQSPPGSPKRTPEPARALSRESAHSVFRPRGERLAAIGMVREFDAGRAFRRELDHANRLRAQHCESHYVEDATTSTLDRRGLLALPESRGEPSCYARNLRPNRAGGPRPRNQLHRSPQRLPGSVAKSQPSRIARAGGTGATGLGHTTSGVTERFAPGPALVPCAPQAATGRGSGFVANAFVKRVAASVAGRA
jgi:hypothetical protein